MVTGIQEVKETTHSVLEAELENGFAHVKSMFLLP